YAAWYPHLPRGLYTAVLAVGVGAAALMTVGGLGRLAAISWMSAVTRVATAATFGVVAYNLFLSTTHVHNNRAYLTIILAGLAVAPAGRRPVGPGWPLWLLRFEAAVVYGASGL